MSDDERDETSRVRGTVLQPGKLCFVREVAELEDGSSVRLVGRVASLDYARNRCSVAHGGATVQVDTRYLDQLEFKVNGLVSVIGEVERDAESGGGKVLRARVCRSVDGLSVEVWDKTVAMHREFMSKLDAV